ncbi:MAG: YbhB/YbcL family Raf kinase inhibitor-like protein [Dehalococcoidia bacterium]
MEFTSPAFANGKPIPSKYTCDGEDISPPLAWGASPQGTKSFALICDDPDAPRGTWVHWVIYNLPPETRALDENAAANLPQGTQHGKTSWGRSDYGGPCPPSGTHRYFFKLYALDTMLNIKAGANHLSQYQQRQLLLLDIMFNIEAGANKDQLVQAMQGHIIGQAETMGVYARQK